MGNLALWIFIMNYYWKIMWVVIQRVSRAAVTIDNTVKSAYFSDIIKCDSFNQIKFWNFYKQLSFTLTFIKNTPVALTTEVK